MLLRNSSFKVLLKHNEICKLEPVLRNEDKVFLFIHFLSYFDSPFPTDFYYVAKIPVFAGFVLAFIEMPSNLRHESVKLEQSQGFIYAHGLMMFMLPMFKIPSFQFFNAKAPWVVVNAIGVDVLEN